ncbi:MAG: glycosyltransferase family 4 protein [Pyrinomonadaceae bacterium]
MEIGLVVSTFLSSLAFIWIFRKLAAWNSVLLDIPNERSSHSQPVIRGAGIGIVLTVLGTYVALFGAQANLAYLLAVISISIVSFLDDLFSVPLLIRLAVHFAAAAIFVFFSGSYNEISAPWFNSSLNFGALAPWISVFFIVGAINAFNFMDGIDGIAGAQGVGVGLGWMLLGYSFGLTTYSNLGAIIVGACAGFLIFNWQPAKVFMGDVGSTFLGFSFAVLPLIDPVGVQRIYPAPIAITIILLWLFLFDTVFTRLRQLFRLQPFWRAHRDHLYQKIALSGASHRAVACFFGLTAVALALAVVYARTMGSAPLILILIFSPVVLMIWARKKRLT